MQFWPVSCILSEKRQMTEKPQMTENKYRKYRESLKRQESRKCRKRRKSHQCHQRLQHFAAFQTKYRILAMYDRMSLMDIVSNPQCCVKQYSNLDDQEIILLESRHPL